MTELEILDKSIRRVPDFPKPGIMFYDVTSIFTNPPVFKYCIDKMVEFCKEKNIDGIAGIESRGFLFAAPLAEKLGIPLVLIILQPDFGTATAYVFGLIFILFVAGIDKRYIIVSITLIVVLVPLLYFFVLPEHAKARIDVYLDPYSDPRGDGYNIIQSEIAIGAGQLLGLGFLKGTQTVLLFIS